MTPAEALAALGDSADAIHRTLKAKGIKGVPTRGECPIARYLDVTTPRRARRSSRPRRSFRVDWAVDGAHAYIPFGEREDSIELPKAVKIFVRRFDQGRYPDLHGDN